MSGMVTKDPTVVLPGTGVPIQLLAATIEFKTAPGGGVGVAELVVDQAFPGPQPHIHRRLTECFYVLEGTFDFLLGERTFTLGQGSFVEVPPGVVHDFRNRGPARLLGIAAGDTDLRRYFEEAQELFVSGAFTPEALKELRERYDTDEVAIDWQV